MALFIEFLSLLWQGFCQTLSGIFDAVYALLPTAMQLNKFASYFTPTGIIVLYFGVPIGVVILLSSICRKLIVKDAIIKKHVQSDE